MQLQFKETINNANPASALQEVIEPNNDHCRKCNAEMKDGQALLNGFSGMPDFIGSPVVSTVSLDPKKFKLIPVSKCPECGWSVSNPMSS